MLKFKGIFLADGGVLTLTQKALDFLVENQLNDSKDWFDAHRGDYERLVREPFFELIDFLGERLAAEVEPELMRDRKRAISRVRRDTRFTNDKTKYRSSVWIMLGRDKRFFPNYPEFFFELRPEYTWWGCGMYFADKPLQDAYRGLILSRSPVFMDAKRAYDAQDSFSLDGDGAFKRTKFPGEPPEIRSWLDRRSIYIAHTVDTEAAFAPDIGERVIEDWRKIYPYYNFLIAACDGAVRGGTDERNEFI